MNSDDHVSQKTTSTYGMTDTGDSDSTRECAVCGDGCGLTVTYHWQNELYDYCLGCAPEAIAEYREQVADDE